MYLEYFSSAISNSIKRFELPLVALSNSAIKNQRKKVRIFESSIFFEGISRSKFLSKLLIFERMNFEISDTIGN